MRWARWGRSSLLVVAVAGWALATPPGEEGARQQTLRIELGPGPACESSVCESEPPSGALRIVPTGGEAAGAEEGETAIIQPFEGWSSFPVALPPAPGFVLEVMDPSYWAPVTVSSGRAEALPLRLHPVTELRLEATSSEDTAPPEAIRVEFSSTAVESFPPDSAEARRRAERVLRGEVACRRTTGVAAWLCRVPSGRMDLRIQARGFASEYLWGLALKPFQKEELGVSLVPGSSLVGWLEAPSGELPEDAEVELLPAGAATGATGVDRLSHVASISDRGLFQFRDLPAGTYRLYVDLPGWAAVDLGPLEILEGRETHLVDPVVLQVPGRLTVCVEPPLPPGVRVPEDAWTVRLSPLDGRFPSSGESVAATGCAHLRDLQPGLHDFILGDERGSRWHRRELEVHSGEQRLDLSVDHFPIEGTLERDSQPIRAQLQFRHLATGEDGARYIRKIDWFVDPEGRFDGALPEPGTWYVYATYRAGGPSVELAAVDIEDRPGEVQKLSLEVSATRVEGRVLDAGGKPARGAEVWMRRQGYVEDRPPGATGRQVTDASGTYVFEGFRPGEYYLTAHRRKAWAEAEVQVAPDTDLPGPTLILEATRELRGFVQSDLGAIPRARVYVLPDDAGVAFRGVGAILTDALGQFRVSVPEQATTVRILVVAVGHGTRLVRLPLGGEDRPILLSMARLAGTLRLTSDLSEPLPAGLRLVVDGVPMPLGLFGSPARSMGGVLGPDAWVLPSMAPGEYRLCDRGLEACSAGFLGAGETLTLEAAE